MAVLAALGIVCFGIVGARTGLAAVSAYVNTGIVIGGAGAARPGSLDNRGGGRGATRPVLSRYFTGVSLSE